MEVAVLSRKGGTAKTVTALHLAGYLAGVSGEDRVLLVDTDPSRNALRSADRPGARYPFVLVGEEEARETIERMKPEHVVVDVKGSPEDEEVMNIARRAEVLVMPAMPGGMELDTVLQTIRDVRKVGRQEMCKVLLAAVPSRFRRGREARRTLEGLGVPLFRAEVKRYEAFVMATDMGRLVRDVPSRKAEKAWRDYVKVGDELVEWVRELRTRDLGPAGRAVDAAAEGAAEGTRAGDRR